jgi:hypothetical protein
MTPSQVSEWLRRRACGQYVQVTDAELNQMADAIDALVAVNGKAEHMPTDPLATTLHPHDTNFTIG